LLANSTFNNNKVGTGVQGACMVGAAKKIRWGKWKLSREGK